MATMTRRCFLVTLSSAAVTGVIPAWAVPRTDLDLIARQQGDTALVNLARALERLTSTLTFMTTGAHPDDEPSALLAALRYHYGISPVIYSITRGEGGQNNIGPERGVALGVLRTREMQEASRALDARLAFGGNDMHDSVHDFGFSKDPHDTLHRWDEDLVIERMVRAIRMYRPDIVFNCFNDVPGQHGHHRAAVLVTDKAVALAAREDTYPQHFEEGLAAWDVPKLYDPAWGGGGSTYDDENPPPPATLIVHAPDRDTISGATWPQMGEWSRACHLTQKMGRWIREPQSTWPLHLRRRSANGVDQKEVDIRDQLPSTLGSLADLSGMNADCAGALREAQQRIDNIRNEYARPEKVLEQAIAIAQALDKAEQHLPESLVNMVSHRLERKKKEISQVIAIAAGIHIRSFIDGKDSTHTQQVEVATLIDAPDHIVVKDVRLMTRPDLQDEVIQGENSRLQIPEDAAFTNPMPAIFDPLGGNGDAYSRVTLDVAGYEITLDIDLEDPLRIVPRHSVEISPDALLINARYRENLTLDTLLQAATLADFRFIIPPTWSIRIQEQLSENHAHFVLTPPEHLKTERLQIVPCIHDKPAWKIEEFSYPHTGKVIVPLSANIPMQVVDAELPASTVAYIGSNNDNVALWLRRLGVTLVELSPAEVAAGAYQNYQTLVIGVFAFGKRKDLNEALPGIHQWVKDGGHLLTLYHRPADGWNPEQTPPAYLKIGSPSIRFRVTDENAEVTHLVPDHPLLNYPNVIGVDDWAAWDKERGLYFASQWDSSYIPLLAMHDPSEKPLEGALLSAEIGKGRHTHTALVLHHQLDKLTPGAFRLMANLIQPARI